MSDVVESRPKAQVLFAGAGGSTLGLMQAGFDTYGWENDMRACWVHSRLTGRAIQMDLSTVPEDEVRAMTGPVWWASPPCQPFSTAGSGDAGDERNGFPWLFRMLAIRQPKWLVIENVVGLLQHRSEKWDRGTCRPGCPACYFSGVGWRLKTLFRHVDFRIMNCSDYGVPQDRKRLIVVCGPKPFAWPEPVKADVSAATALGLDPSTPLSVGGPNARSGRGPSVRTCASPAPTVRTHADIYICAAWHTGEGRPRDLSRPSPTITTKGTAQFVDRTGARIRTLTVEERAKLQCLPYVKGMTGKQIGNAVPPPLAEAIGRQLLRHIAEDSDE